jgi:hypothetical protein
LICIRDKPTSKSKLAKQIQIDKSVETKSVRKSETKLKRLRLGVALNKGSAEKGHQKSLFEQTLSSMRQNNRGRF